MCKKLTYKFVKQSFEDSGYELLSNEYVNTSTKLNYKCTKGHEHSIIWINWYHGCRCPTCAGKSKPTIKYINTSFKQEGYTLLSKEYINASTKLDYRCTKNHEHSITWSDWNSGYRCPYCYGNIKPTIEFVKQSFNKDNYILLSTEYINAHVKLEYKCSKGHEHSITWNGWRQGNRCPTCAGQTKPTIEYIKESFINEGYTLLTKEYINAQTKLDYRCPEGHEHSISWNCWQRGHRCYACFGSLKPTIDQVRESFEDDGYTLLSTEYVNSSTKLNYKCSEGHEHSIRWSHWKQGSRCLICSGKVKLTLEQVRESFKNEDYILLSEEYTNNNTKLKYKCSKNHEHSMIWINWKSGHRCPTCRDINLSSKFSGAGGPGWKGGISYEPYCPIWSDKEYKQYIRERDGNKCLNPYCYSNKPDKLAIHHIDYNKKNCQPSNLITVCNSCNSSANKDRDWHTAWYQALIHMRYNRRQQ